MRTDGHKNNSSFSQFCERALKYIFSVGLPHLKQNEILRKKTALIMLAVSFL